ELPEVQLFSLQKGDGREQVQALAEQIAVTDWTDQMDNTTGPFLDTAALMKNLDLVVTADTSIAHLAGALGVPDWIVLSTSSDWRWMLARDDSRWYPSARLFRQTQRGDWTDVFARLTTAVQQAISQRPRG